MPSAEGSQFQLHPSWSAGWTLSGEDLGKFGLEKAIFGAFEAILTPLGHGGPLWTVFGPILTRVDAI